MHSPTAVGRDAVDACPGALTLHEAADGALARVRLPGGAVTAAQLETLRSAADELGDGSLELTSRGNVQLRGLGAAGRDELGAVLADAGLLPSATHERVRNIIASPLSGIDGMGTDVSTLAAHLDRQLCARARLADLSGRFLFAIDDGRGDVAQLDADVTAQARGRRAGVGGFDVPLDGVVSTMLAFAEAFLALRDEDGSTAWRIAELSGGSARVADRAMATVGVAADAPLSSNPDKPAEPVGIVDQPDGRHAVVLLAPLGRLDQHQTRLLVDSAGDRGLRVTPWRSVVIPDVHDTARLIAAAAVLGFGVDANSPWYRVSACVGQPGCARALADVQADARQAAMRWPGQRVRWSGCDKRCGRPPDTEIDLVATGDGYQITGATS